MVHSKLASCIMEGIYLIGKESTGDYGELQGLLEKESAETLIISMRIMLNRQLYEIDKLREELGTIRSRGKYVVNKYNELANLYDLLSEENKCLKDKIVRLGGQPNISGRIKKEEKRALKKGTDIDKILYLQNIKGLSDKGICDELGISRKTLYNRRLEAVEKLGFTEAQIRRADRK